MAYSSWSAELCARAVLWMFHETGNELSSNGDEDILERQLQTRPSGDVYISFDFAGNLSSESGTANDLCFSLQTVPLRLRMVQVLDLQAWSSTIG